MDHPPPPSDQDLPQRPRRRLTAAYILTGLVTTVFLVAAGVGFYLQGLVHSSIQNWERYQEYRQAQIGWLHEVRIEMGFGGLTSHLFAYATSADDTAAYRAERSLRRLKNLVEQRRAVATPEEVSHLNTLWDGIDHYQLRLSSAKAMVRDGAPLRDVASVLQPDIFEMTAALNRMESLVAVADAEQNAEVETRFQTLSTIKSLIYPLIAVTLLAAIGVVGLIYRFGQEMRRRETSEEAVLHFTNRMRQEIDMAQTVQTDLLPTPGQIAELSRNSALDISYRLLPSTELSGDFWIPLDLGDGRIVVLLADMTGHGLVAAMNGLRMTDVVMRANDYFVINSSHLLRNLSADLIGVLPDGHFAAAALALYDPVTHTVEVAGAAFPAPLLYHHLSDTVEALRVRGLPLGITEDARYDGLKRDIAEESTLLLYSDALIETKDKDGKTVSEDDLASWIRDAVRARDAGETQDIAGVITSHALARLGGELPDDLTVIAITIPASRPKSRHSTNLEAFVAALDQEL